MNDLSPQTNIDDILEAEENGGELESRLKPYSSRIKVIVEYDFEIKRYKLSQ